MPNSAYNSIAYRINTDTEDEFYIMENRQQTGFDRFIPGTGLLIWHIHSSLATYLYYGANNINNTHPQLMYPVCAAATVAQPNSNSNSYGNINSDGTPFPGASNNTKFTDNSIPSARSWVGKTTNRAITNITEVNALISFNYKGRPDVIFNIPYLYDIIDGSHFTKYYTNINSVENATVKWNRMQENDNKWSIEIRSNSNSNSEHYLFLPAFQLYGNYIYSFKVDYKIYSNLYAGNMKLYLCNSKNINDKILIEDFGDALTKTTFTPLTTTFIVPTDDIYYIAIHSYTKGDYMDMFIRNIKIEGVVGIEEEIENNNINIFPNPANNNIYIVNSLNENIESIDFFDKEGKTILTTKDTNIDISKLSSGTYLIRIKTNNKIYSKSIIKK
jgi:hypothetical protein